MVWSDEFISPMRQPYSTKRTSNIGELVTLHEKCYYKWHLTIFKCRQKRAITCKLFPITLICCDRLALFFIGCIQELNIIKGFNSSSKGIIPKRQSRNFDPSRGPYGVTDLPLVFGVLQYTYIKDSTMEVGEEFLGSSTIHGLSHILSAKVRERLNKVFFTKFSAFF